MNYVSESIEFALSVCKTGYTREWCDGISARAANLETNASGELRAFKTVPRVYPGNGEQVTELRPVTDGIHASATILANNAWGYIGGEGDPDRAKQIIAVARAEYARTAFHTLLWNCGMLRADKTMHTRGEGAAEYVMAELNRRDWADADGVTREPATLWWFGDMAAENFSDWSANLAGDTDSISPAMATGGIDFGLALAWIDEAVFNPSAALALLAEAACAMRWGGFLCGWEGHEEMVKEEQTAESKSLAKRGAHARHAGNRAMKERAIAAFRAGNFRSKDMAAEAIAGHLVPVTFRTARDWLKGV